LLMYQLLERSTLMESNSMGSPVQASTSKVKRNRSEEKDGKPHQHWICEGEAAQLTA